MWQRREKRIELFLWIREEDISTEQNFLQKIRVLAKQLRIQETKKRILSWVKLELVTCGS